MSVSEYELTVKALEVSEQRRALWNKYTVSHFEEDTLHLQEKVALVLNDFSHCEGQKRDT